MSSWVKPMTKVICGDDSGWKLTDPWLMAGKTYTIDNVVWGGLFINLIEDPRLHWPMRGWFKSRFRPVHTLETDMTVFRKIASNLPTAKELEDSVQLALERLNVE